MKARAFALCCPVLGLALSAAPSFGQDIRQLDVVCDLTPILAGPVEGDGLTRAESSERIRLTFGDLDPKAGTGKVLFGDGASGEEFVAMTVDPHAITYCTSETACRR